MSFLSFASQAIIVVLPTQIEERGEIVDDWDSPTRETVDGCSVQPGSGRRDFDHADAVEADFTVYAPPTATIPRRARIELPVTDGQFIILGEPEPWIYGMSTDHIRFRLSRRDG